MHFRLTSKRFREFLASLVLAGCISKPSVASAHITLESEDGVFWFKDSAGKHFVAQSVVHVTYDGDDVLDTKRRPYREAVESSGLRKPSWAEQTLHRIREWGFNSLGAWSDGELQRRLPYTLALNLQKELRTDGRKIIDVFAPNFEPVAMAYAERACRPRVADEQLIGYFSDNELRWGPDWRGKEELLELYLALPPEAPGRAVAERYFGVVSRAIRAADPSHLYLGARFQTVAPPRAGVVRAASVADVVSFNFYGDDPTEMARRFHQLSGRPVLVSEFAFRARDAGLPNRKGAGPILANQDARGAAYRTYVTRLMSLPEAVGYQWFQWSDEPKEGRPGGEDSNFGVVTIGNEPYPAFVKKARAANAAAVTAHAASGAKKRVRPRREAPP
jgi:hypothetical protein